VSKSYTSSSCFSSSRSIVTHSKPGYMGLGFLSTLSISMCLIGPSSIFSLAAISSKLGTGCVFQKAWLAMSLVFLPSGASPVSISLMLSLRIICSRSLGFFDLAINSCFSAGFDSSSCVIWSLLRCPPAGDSVDVISGAFPLPVSASLILRFRLFFFSAPSPPSTVAVSSSLSSADSAAAFCLLDSAVASGAASAAASGLESLEAS
jgi:hypothetical protein